MYVETVRPQPMKIGGNEAGKRERAAGRARHAWGRHAVRAQCAIGGVVDDARVSIRDEAA